MEQVYKLKEDDTPLHLLSAMKKNTQLTSCHMPAHCGNEEICPELSQAIKEYGVFSLEGTTDEDFHHIGNFNPPSGAFEKTLNWTTSVYQTKATFFSVNGSTGSILGLTRVMGSLGKKVLIQRNSHRSIIHGFRASGIKDDDIVYVHPDYNEKFDVYHPVTAEQVSKCLDEDPEIQIAFLISPTYEGLSADLEQIGSICKKRNVKLLIDASHGSLFPFDKRQFPASGLEVDGVEGVVQSLHKGAGAFSQTSVVHITKGSSIDPKTFCLAKLLQESTSPSTMLLSSMEEAIKVHASSKGAEFRNRAIGTAQRIKAQISEIPGVEILKSNEFKQDPTKICLRAEGFSGTALAKGLKESHFIDCEIGNCSSILLSIHIGTNPEIEQKLPKALQDLIQDKSLRCMAGSAKIQVQKLPNPQYVYSINETFTKKRKSVKVMDSIGRVSFAIISPCPPGCIIVDIGERITKEHEKYLSSLSYVDIVDEESENVNEQFA